MIQKSAEAEVPMLWFGLLGATVFGKLVVK